MHNRLTVVWIFILWAILGLTDCRPQHDSNAETWKPLIPNPKRIDPQEPQHPSIDQHTSRYLSDVEKNNLNINLTLENLKNALQNNRRKNDSTINSILLNYIKRKEQNRTLSNRQLYIFEKIRSLISNNRDDISLVNNFIENNLLDLYDRESSVKAARKQTLKSNTISKRKRIKPKPPDEHLKYWPDTNIHSNEEFEIYENYTNINNDKSKIKIHYPHKTQYTYGQPTTIKVPSVAMPTSPTIHKNPGTYMYPNLEPTPSVNTKPVSMVVDNPYPSAIEIPKPMSVRPVEFTSVYELRPLSSSTKRPSIKCPTVFITALTSFRENNTIFTREGCTDLSIVINSQLNNHNMITTDDRVSNGNKIGPPNSPASNTPASPNSQIQDPGGQGAASTNNFNIRPPAARPPSNQNQASDSAEDDETFVTSMIQTLASPSSWLDAFSPMLGVLLTPLSVIAAGGLSLLALLFPFSIPSLLVSRSSRKYPIREEQSHYTLESNVQPVNGWYWHDGYQTWSNRPPQAGEYDRRRRYTVDYKDSNNYRPVSPYYYGYEGKRRKK